MDKNEKRQREREKTKTIQVSEIRYIVGMPKYSRSSWHGGSQGDWLEQ